MGCKGVVWFLIFVLTAVNAIPQNYFRNGTSELGKWILGAPDSFSWSSSTANVVNSSQSLVSNGRFHKRSNSIGWTSMGCYNVDALSGWSSQTAGLTQNECIVQCAGIGYSYAGMYNGHSCKCGLSILDWTKVSGCSSSCSGASDQICGGDNVMSIFTGNPTGTKSQSEKCGPDYFISNQFLSTSAPFFIDQMLKYHNMYRAKYRAVAVEWNDDMAAVAATNAKTCVFAHTQNNIYGENIAAGTMSDPAYLVELWFNESSLYNFNDPGYSSETGHFTAMVWQDMTRIGCAWEYCPDGEYTYYLVCDYGGQSGTSAPLNGVPNIVGASYFEQNVWTPWSTVGFCNAPMSIS